MAVNGPDVGDACVRLGCSTSEKRPGTKSRVVKGTRAKLSVVPELAAQVPRGRSLQQAKHRRGW
jgi:hypothetical protein